MRLAVFGATGTVGSELLAQALDAGHEVRVLARTPTKLAARAGLAIVAGDAKDQRAVARTLTGCDVALSALGSTDRHDQGVRSIGTANILAAMRELGIRRLVIMGGFHLPFDGDRGKLGQALIAPVLRLAYGRALLEDTHAMAALLRESELDWTLVRAPRVVSASRPVATRTGRLSLGPWSKVSHASVAGFMLRCTHDETTIRQAPMICHSRRARPALSSESRRSSMHAARRLWEENLGAVPVSATPMTSTRPRRQQ
jgi:putative NADH-flavin reductase